MFTLGALSKAAALLLCASSAQAAFKPKHITYYDFPEGLSGPCDLSTGPDGAIWVSHFTDPIISRIDPKTGNITQINIPYKTAPVLNITVPKPFRKLANRPIFSCVSQPGEDGNMYFASGVRNEFAKLYLKTGKVKVFSFNNIFGNLEPFNDMWRGPPGTGMFISQTTANKISMISYETEKITSFTPPTKLSGPLGLYYATDGHMWFAEFIGNKIGRLNITSGEIKEYDVPAPLTGPTVTRAETRDKHGNHYVWFCGLIGNKMGRINIKTGHIKLYDLPQPESLPLENTVDSLGKIWYSSGTYNTVNRLDPKTGHVNIIEELGYVTTQPGVPPAFTVAMHYGPGKDMWWTELLSNRVGRLNLPHQVSQETCCDPLPVSQIGKRKKKHH